MPLPPGIIIGWPGSVATIPAGWNRVTALDLRHPRCSSTAGALGGLQDHSHDFAAHSHTGGAHSHTGNTNAAEGAQRLENGPISVSRSVSHIHAFTTVSASPIVAAAVVYTSSTSSFPLYWDLIFICPFSPPPVDGIPNGAVCFWAEPELPDGFILPANGKGRFPRGAPIGSGGGGLGGSPETHTHDGQLHSHTLEHTHPDTNSSSWQGEADNALGSGASSIIGALPHAHGGIGGYQVAPSTQATPAINPASGWPPWKKIGLIQNVSGESRIPHKVIALWDGPASEIPPDWEPCDGAEGRPDYDDDVFLLGATTLAEVGQTGGAAQHTHTSQAHAQALSNHAHSGETTTTLPTPGPAYYDENDELKVIPHVHSYTTDSAGAPLDESPGQTSTPVPDNNLPLYKSLILIQYNPPKIIAEDHNIYGQRCRLFGHPAKGDIWFERLDLRSGEWSEPMKPIAGGPYPEGSIECLADGRLRIVCVSTDRTYLKEAFSSDDGDTWNAT